MYDIMFPICQKAINFRYDCHHDAAADLMLFITINLASTFIFVNLT